MVFSKLANNPFTDWDQNLVTEATWYGRFANDDLMQMGMGLGIGARIAAFEETQQGIALVQARQIGITAQYSMGIGFPLTRRQRQITPYVGVGIDRYEYLVDQATLTPINEFESETWGVLFEYGFVMGYRYNLSQAWDVGVDIAFDGASSRHTIDELDEFQANVR